MLLFEDLQFQISVVEFFIIIVFSCWDHFSFDSFFFLITWWYIFFSHKWPLLLFEPYKSDSRAVNRAPPELGFGTPLGGKLGFWSAASPTWLRVPTIFKKDLCHCLWVFFIIEAQFHEFIINFKNLGRRRPFCRTIPFVSSRHGDESRFWK